MLSAIMKLKVMLTARNLQFLSAVLDIILHHPQAAPVVWEAFSQRFKNAAVASDAHAKLTDIKRIVDEYRRSIR